MLIGDKGGDNNQTGSHIDTTAPIIVLIGDKNITVIQNSAYEDAGATATDDMDGNLTNKIQSVSTVNVRKIGIYKVTYDVNDSAGNQAIQETRNVNVIMAPDTIRPVITLLGESNISIIENDMYVDAGATANDDRDGNISHLVQTTGAVDTSSAGVYTLYYDVNDSSGNQAIQVSRTVNIFKEEDTTNPIFKEFNVGFGGSSSFPFVDDRNNSKKIWVSAKDLVLDDNIQDNNYYSNIKDFNSAAFSNLHDKLKIGKYIIFWIVEGWQESWFNTSSIQDLINAGYIPVFNYWYFGDTLVSSMPDENKINDYKEDNIKVADFLAKLNGEIMLIMEPEFNKQPVLDNQHEFANIISEAIDTIRAKKSNLLISLSMTDTGSRGVDDKRSSCGYNNCSLGDKASWALPETVFEDLSAKLDFISFHQMLGQFSRDPSNPGDWNNPNPRSYTDDELGIEFTVDRIKNFAKYLHDKYNKPIFMPYIGIMTATWDDTNSDGDISTDEINSVGWENRATNIYKNLSESKDDLLENGLFGFATMALFDNPRHDYGGYQYFINNEYHLGIIGSGARDEVDIASYGDLRFKGDDILGYIFGE